MPYDALTDRVMPYHLDGTVIKQIHISSGVVKTFSNAEMLELNDEDYTNVGISWLAGASFWFVFFFPELVDVTGIFMVGERDGTLYAPTDIEWSANTTNGLDGTWVNATMPNGFNSVWSQLDSWRTGIKAMTGVAGANALRIMIPSGAYELKNMQIMHLYGHKTAGQTPNDILFLDAEAADAELTVPLNFNDVPTASSVQRIIKVKNSSATLTASTIVITVVDPDDQIRIGVSNTGPWLTAQTVASLAPAAKSAAFYIKCEAPAAPTPLGPNRAPIKVNVGSWA